MKSLYKSIVLALPTGTIGINIEAMTAVKGIVVKQLNKDRAHEQCLKLADPKATAARSVDDDRDLYVLTCGEVYAWCSGLIVIRSGRSMCRDTPEIEG
ncbi:hypothetical protein PoB_002998700 [Plakobranchus ocellatus]|uniref:Uncharacterized protein n=1 Tax=Plakobranchus ocellatus TaxID=259542 RepID=A0AAV4A949_9GAST|nr:hypothetical protein PoB_002998700 [Plakobranchus ocellatus]